MATLNQHKKVLNTQHKKANNEEAWEVEIETIKNIKEGKVEMETQTSEELLAELKDLENEP